jgi:hypothetical protein
MGPKLIINGSRRAFPLSLVVPSIWHRLRKRRHAGIMWSRSMIAANVRGAMNASGVRRRTCLSTLPSRSAISANDRMQPDAMPSISVDRVAERAAVPRRAGNNWRLRRGQIKKRFLRSGEVTPQS